MTWQLREAKQKFSQLIKQAVAEGPQAVTRQGKTVVIIVSAEDFRRLTGGKRDFTDFLLSGPDVSALEIERTAERPPNEQGHPAPGPLSDPTGKSHVPTENPLGWDVKLLPVSYLPNTFPMALSILSTAFLISPSVWARETKQRMAGM